MHELVVKAREIADIARDTQAPLERRGQAFLDLAKIMEQFGLFDEAEDILQIARRLFGKARSEAGLCEAYIFWARICRRLNCPKLAKYYLECAHQKKEQIEKFLTDALPDSLDDSETKLALQQEFALKILRKGCGKVYRYSDDEPSFVRDQPGKDFTGRYVAYIVWDDTDIEESWNLPAALLSPRHASTGEYFLFDVCELLGVKFWIAKAETESSGLTYVNPACEILDHLAERESTKK